MLRRFEHVLASRRSMQQTMAKCMKPGHLASYYTVVHQQRWLSATPNSPLLRSSSLWSAGLRCSMAALPFCSPRTCSTISRPYDASVGRHTQMPYPTVNLNWPVSFDGSEAEQHIWNSSCCYLDLFEGELLSLQPEARVDEIGGDAWVVAMTTREQASSSVLRRSAI